MATEPPKDCPECGHSERLTTLDDEHTPGPQLWCGYCGALWWSSNGHVDAPVLAIAGRPWKAERSVAAPPPVPVVCWCGVLHQFKAPVRGENILPDGTDLSECIVPLRASCSCGRTIVVCFQRGETIGFPDYGEPDGGRRDEP